MKKLLLSALFLFSNNVFAGGWTNTAAVVDVEIIRDQGFQISGSFGNPSECSTSNTIFVATDHPQYDQLLSLTLTAFTSGKRLRIYSHTCINYGWHGGTYNQLTSAGAMYIKN